MSSLGQDTPSVNTVLIASMYSWIPVIAFNKSVFCTNGLDIFHNELSVLGVGYLLFIQRVENIDHNMFQY